MTPVETKSNQLANGAPKGNISQGLDLLGSNIVCAITGGTLSACQVPSPSYGVGRAGDSLSCLAVFRGPHYKDSRH